MGAKKGGKSAPSSKTPSPSATPPPAGADLGTSDQDPEGKPKTLYKRIKNRVRKRIASKPLDSSSSSGWGSPCPENREGSALPPTESGALSRQDAGQEVSGNQNA